MAYLGLLLNWLATHLVLLGLLVFLLLGLYFKEPIFGNTLGGLNPSIPRAAGATASASSGEEEGDTSGAGKEHGLEPDVPATSGHTGSVPASAGEPEVTDGVDPVFRPTRENSASLLPESEKGEKGDSPFRDPDHAAVVTAQKAEKAMQRLLMAGRNAFSREDFKSAETHYLRYLSERPEDPEAFAELGNLYRVMGRTEDALDAYYEAAVRFRDLDEWGEVRQLGGILDRAGDSRGARILQLPR